MGNLRFDPPSVLIVDDDVALAGVMEQAVAAEGGYRIVTVTDGDDALTKLREEDFDIVVTDYALGSETLNGLDILKKARELHPDILGIIVTAYASLEISIEAIRWGAYDFLTKPFQLDEFRLAVRNAAERVRLTRENHHLRRQVTELAASMREIRHDYRGLMDQLDLRRSLSLGALAPSAGEAGPRHGRAQQIEAYLSVGETIGEKIDRENQRLERLFQEGVIPERVFRENAAERDLTAEV